MDTICEPSLLARCPRSSRTSCGVTPRAVHQPPGLAVRSSSQAGPLVVESAPQGGGERGCSRLAMSLPARLATVSLPIRGWCNASRAPDAFRSSRRHHQVSGGVPPIGRVRGAGHGPTWPALLAVSLRPAGRGSLCALAHRHRPTLTGGSASGIRRTVTRPQLRGSVNSVAPTADIVIWQGHLGGPSWRTF